MANAPGPSTAATLSAPTTPVRDLDRSERYGAVHAHQLRAVATAFLRLRPRIVFVGLSLAVLLLFAADVPRMQLTALCVGFTVMLTFFSVEAWRARTRQVSEGGFAASLLVTTVGITVACVFSGGLRSPVVPILFAPVVTCFAAFGRRRVSRIALAQTLTLTTLLAALPTDVPFPRIPEPWDTPFVAVAMAVSLALLWSSVTGLTDAFGRTGRRLDHMRVEAVEESARRLASLEAVGAKVAHEVKNPLSAIKGLVQLSAERSELSERERKRLGVVLDEVARIEQILGDYLSFSRPLAELRLEPTAVDSLLEELAELLEARGAVVALELEPVTVHADRGRLKAALLNLGLNAVQASPSEERARLRVALRCVEGGGARIDVADAGQGMSAEQLAQLGTPFFTTRSGGTGLGVVLARAVITQHGGRLDYASVLGEGTTASVTLPAIPGGGGV